MANVTTSPQATGRHAAARPPDPALNGRPPGWRRLLAESVRQAADLCRLLGLPDALAAEAAQAAEAYPVLVPRPFLQRIRPGDPNDPLLRQVLPRKQECQASPGYSADPLGEIAACRGDGWLQKYHGRSLILSTDRCAVHCRYCFRRHLRSKGSSPLAVASPHETDNVRLAAEPAPLVGGRLPARLRAALGRVPRDGTIDEIILSGGDPLVFDDAELTAGFRVLARLPSLQRLRIHTRLPVVIPQRVTDGLLAALRSTRLATFVVVQANHAREIDAEVAAALGRLVDAGVPVLSQSVLLSGVNDSVEALAALFRRLVDLRVMPYYLHQLDPVAGAAHFEVPIREGRRLVAALRARLPGYAVPRYARETPGAPNKEVLA